MIIEDNALDSALTELADRLVLTGDAGDGEGILLHGRKLLGQDAAWQHTVFYMQELRYARRHVVSPFTRPRRWHGAFGRIRHGRARGAVADRRHQGHPGPGW